MIIYKKEFRVGHYVRAFEKSLNYMCAAFLAIVIVYFGERISTSAEPFEEIKRILWPILFEGDSDNILPKVFIIIIGVLSALPYFFYYTLKDNYEWNLYSGRKDLGGLLKIYMLYEIFIIGLFYILLPKTDYEGSKLIAALIGFLLSLTYILILFYQYKRGEDIGYFLMLIILLGAFFSFLVYKNAVYKNERGLTSLRELTFFMEQNYDNIVFMLLFLFNSFINTIFLHKFDSCAETGIISNRIKIIIPTITFSVYTPAIMYCYLYEKPENVTMMLLAGAGITLYEIVISFIRTQETNAKVFGCVSSFAVFVSGIALFIWNYVDKSTVRKELVEYWFLLIGLCIYFVALKYYGAIVKLQFPKENDGESKGKIMRNVIWLRNGLLGSMLFLLVNYTFTNKYFGVTIAIIFSASLAEFFICQYVFNTKRNLYSRSSYLIGRAIELITMLIPVLFFIMEKSIDINWEKPFNNNPAILVLAVIVALLTLVAGLYMYIISKYNKGKWEKIPELNRQRVLHEIMERFRNFNKLTNSVLHDKNVEDFWMAILCWGIFISISFFSLLSCACGLIKPTDIGKTQILGGVEISYAVFSIIFLIVIVGVDWLFLSKNIFNYYMNKMEEGKMVKKFYDAFQVEWKKCLREMKDFKELDAEQLYSGNYYRPLLFFFGAAYQPEVNLSKQKTYHIIARAACCIELLHKSDTIIDDYIDEDTSRNGQKSFYVQYEDTKKMILFRDALQAKALMILDSCRKTFLCSEHAIAHNMVLLSQNLYDISRGRYQELSLADYGRIEMKDIEEVILHETVSLFQNSIKLGYSCFHAHQGNEDCKKLENFGTALGKFYQYMNDRDPFVKTAQYQKYKGEKNNIGKKNMVMLKLYERFAYEHPSEEARENFLNGSYKTIQNWYNKYCLEEEILQEADNRIKEMKKIMKELKQGNACWCENFKEMFNAMLSDRGWMDKTREF